MLTPQPGTQVEVNLPTPEHAAYIGIYYLKQANAHIDRALKPHPEDSGHRTAARLNAANRAIQTALDIFHDLPEPQERSPAFGEYQNACQEVRPLYEHAKRTITVPSPPSDILSWYTSMEQAISHWEILSGLQNMAVQPPRSETEREARTILAEQLHHRHANPEGTPLPRPDSGSTQAEIHRLSGIAGQATRNLLDLAQDMMQRYDDSLVLQMSPKLKERSLIAMEAARIPCTPSSVVIGIDIAEETHEKVAAAEKEIQEAYLQNRDPSDVPTIAELEQWIFPFIVFAHDGRKIAKHVTEPYPKAYPPSSALAHMRAAVQIMESSISGEMDGPAGTTIAAAIIRDMGKAAEHSVHDLTTNDLKALDQAMERENIPKGARIAAFKAIFNWNPRIAKMITSNAISGWRRQLPPDSARKVVNTAKAEGMDPYALQSLITALGYHPQELDTPELKLTPGQLDAIAMHARILGVSEQAISRMTDNL